ncbi:MAG: RNA pseudouridine synthase [Candidatus Doudnabacteria bacterium]|nr:RNA pseudouridine synthase [Candidatus Doudnabacteria bacterium]
MGIKIEYENDDLAVIGKPAGIPVYSTKKRVAEDSVLTWFLKKYPWAKKVGDQDRPGIIHRLDKQTSGLLILAKTQAGYDYLGRIFRRREIVKEYLALVYGELPKHGVIDRPLTKIGQEGRSKVRVDEGGKEAVTEYWSLGYYQRGVDPVKSREAGLAKPEFNRVDQFTLLRVKLHTGRTHQIRVHFSSIKHPVVGDTLYGKPLSQKLSDILHRQFLHASRLEFKLMDGTWLEIQSELPPDLQKVLVRLQKMG